MAEFDTKWQWKVLIVGEGYADGQNKLIQALNASWTITKTTPTASTVVYILKKLKEETNKGGL